MQVISKKNTIILLNMDIQEVINTEKLVKQIHACVSENFTGQLDIKNTQLLHNWSLYFYQGSLIWAASSVHPMRRLYRHLSVHCPELSVYTGLSQGSDKPVYRDDDLLAELMKQGKLRWEQMVAIIEGQIKEILFDLQQQSEIQSRSKMSLTYKRIYKNTIDSTNSRLVLIKTMHLWQQAKQAWEAWCQAGLKDYSPNLAPVIRQAKQLRQQTSAVAYHNLISLADGNWTLRDLAVKLKQNLLPLTQSIMPYIHQGLIGLLEVDDFRESFQPKLATNNVSHRGEIGTEFEATGVRLKGRENDVKSGNKYFTPSPHLQAAIAPLVACIDDNKNDSQIMNRILTQADYQFINIQDPVKALLVLLEHKPDLIFLDLVMPIVNGYEICSQIRRISVFKDTPVIILTNNDRIVDRVRAKVVGASGFLGKPIKQEKVLKIVRKHLAARKSAQSQRLQTQFLKPKVVN